MKNDGVIIEVGLNESVSRASHRFVAQTPAECAADALRCASAGAALMHWHAVGADGTQQLDNVELYGEALDAIDGEIIAYPSYRTDLPDTVEMRLAHCLALRELHGLEVAPIDVATVNLVLWDPSTNSIGPQTPTHGFDTITNSLPFVIDAIARYQDCGLTPTFASFDLGSTRTIGALASAGLLPCPAMVKIFLWGGLCIGPEPSIEALDLHLAQLPTGVDIEWIVVPYAISDPSKIESLSIAALERGGGVRIGIGDNPVAYADKTNAQLVELAATWVMRVGRQPSTAHDVRSRLKMSHV